VVRRILEKGLESYGLLALAYLQARFDANTAASLLQCVIEVVNPTPLKNHQGIQLNTADIVLFGPLGFLWKLTNMKDTILELKMAMVKMRLCHFGDKFIPGKPSGSFLQVASTRQNRP